MRSLFFCTFTVGLTAIAASVAVPCAVVAQAIDALPATEDGKKKSPDAIRIGGHFGFVVPILRGGNGIASSNLSDRFIFGFPVGLTVKPRGPVAVDFEFIPTFNTGDDLVVTIHPGVIYGFARSYAVGLRAAYDAGSTNDSYGVTALISRSFAISNKRRWFAELDVPIRRQLPPLGRDFTSIAIAGHLGLSF